MFIKVKQDYIILNAQSDVVVLKKAISKPFAHKINELGRKNG